MASVEQTFTYPERIDFALIKEATSLIAEYRIYSYEESNSFTTIPLFISSRACASPLGVEVEFNPRARPFLQTIKSAILDLNERGLLTPQNLANRINAFEWPIGRACFNLKLDVSLLDSLNTDPELYSFRTRAQFESRHHEFDEYIIDFLQTGTDNGTSVKVSL
jgi:hypothetical protein